MTPQQRFNKLANAPFRRQAQAMESIHSAGAKAGNYSIGLPKLSSGNALTSQLLLRLDCDGQSRCGDGGQSGRSFSTPS